MTNRIVRLAALCLVAVGAVFCAPPDEAPDSPQLQLTMSRAFSAAQVQISVLKGAKTLLEQPNLEKRCIKDVAAEIGAEFLLLRLGTDGTRRKAVAFDDSETDVTLTGIEPGSDYLFVAEAVSGKVPPTLVASGRSRVDKFEAKENTLINLTLLGTPDGGDLAGCDPLIPVGP